MTANLYPGKIVLMAPANPTPSTQPVTSQAPTIFSGGALPFPEHNHLFVIALLGFLAASTAETQPIVVDDIGYPKDVCRQWLYQWLGRNNLLPVFENQRPELLLRQSQFLKQVLIPAVGTHQSQEIAQTITGSNLPPRELLEHTQETLSPIQATQATPARSLKTRQVLDLAKMRVADQLKLITNLKQAQLRFAAQTREQNVTHPVFSQAANDHEDYLQKMAAQQATKTITETVAVLDPQTPITPQIASVIAQRTFQENPILHVAKANPAQLSQAIYDEYGGTSQPNQQRRENVTQAVREQIRFQQATAPRTENLHAQVMQATNLSPQLAITLVAQLEARLIAGQTPKQALADTLLAFRQIPNNHVLTMIEQLSPTVEAYTHALPILRSPTQPAIPVPGEITEATIQYNTWCWQNNRSPISLTTTLLRSQGLTATTLSEAALPSPLLHQLVVGPLEQLETDRVAIPHHELIFIPSQRLANLPPLTYGSPNPIVTQMRFLAQDQFLTAASAPVSSFRMAASQWLLQKFGSWTTQAGAKKMVGQIATWAADKLATEGLTKAVANGVGTLVAAGVSALGLPEIAPFVQRVVTFVTEKTINFVSRNWKKLATLGAALLAAFLHWLLSLSPWVLGIGGTGLGLYLIPINPLLGIPTLTLGVANLGRALGSWLGQGLPAAAQSLGSSLSSFVGLSANAAIPAYIALAPLAAIGAVAVASLFSMMTLAGAFVLPPLEGEPTAAAGAQIVWPTSGTIVKGPNSTTAHTGIHSQAIDISAPLGTPVQTPFIGKVLKVANDADGYGRYVKIKNAGGLIAILAHLNTIAVTEGQTISSVSTLVGTVGSTGNSSGPHLHLEVNSGNILNMVSLSDQDKATINGCTYGVKSCGNIHVGR